MTLLSKLWPGLSLAIIAILAFCLIRGCVRPAPVPTAAAIQHGYDSAKNEDAPVIALWQDSSRALLTQVDTLRADLFDSQDDLQSRAGDISRNLAGLDQARIIHDTGKILLHADTLESQVKEGIPAVTGYVRLSDSIVNACVTRGQVQDSIIARLTRLNRIADTTISRQRLYYEILHKDDAAKTAELRIYKPVAISAGIVVLVKAAQIILKFIHK